jgi:hypothetical protein
LGGLGHFAANLFFHPRDSPIPLSPPTPVEAYNFARPSAAVAHRVATGSSLHVAYHATTHWSLARPGVRFGRTYHTMTPQQWCFQALSLNITHALGTYLRTALSVLSLTSPTHKSSLPRTKFFGTVPFAPRVPAPVLIAAAPHSPRTYHA